MGIPIPELYITVEIQNCCCVEHAMRKMQILADRLGAFVRGEYEGKMLVVEPRS